MPVCFDVYGHFSTPCGLKVSADNTVRFLELRGASVRKHTVYSDHEVDVTGPPPEPGEQAINVFHINPLSVIGLLRTDDHRPFDWRHRLNVCVPFWELPHVPDAWLPVLRGMDVVLAPTRFVADAVHASDPSINVMPFPQTVDVPEGIESQRARFALPEDATIFGMSFAAQAVIERKNPWAAIEAFRLAFPTEADVRLVVRAYDAGGADASPTLRRLRDAAADDPRILIDGERLAYEDVVALYASCDAYVSLHRSEGLGLGPMEAMTVGTPVVATNWSGVLDFMTEYNSCLVDYELVPVDVDPTSPYSSDSIGFDECWAEPDVDDAARLMCKLYCEPEWRRELGRRAMHDMRERHQRIESAPFIDDLISLAGRVDDPSQGHGTRARSLERLQNEMINERRIIAFKRAVVRVLRALRLKPPAPESELRD